MSCCFGFLGPAGNAGAHGSTTATAGGSEDSYGGYSVLAAASRSSRAFLKEDHSSAREAVDSLLKGGALASGLELHFYSSSDSRGRQAIVLDDKKSDSEFRLVASSSTKTVEGHTVSARHEAILKASEAAQMAQVMSWHGLEGLLLVDAPSSLAAHIVAEAVGLWAAVLGDRLSLIETRLDADATRKAMDSALQVVSTMVFRSQNLDQNSGRKAETQFNFIPDELITGGILAQHHTTWSLENEGDELVQNDNGKYDGPRVPLSKSVVGMPLGPHKSKVVAIQHSDSDNKFSDYMEVHGVASTICIPVDLPVDELNQIMWRRSSMFVRPSEKQTMERQESGGSDVRSGNTPNSASFKGAPTWASEAGTVLGDDVAVIQLCWLDNGDDHVTNFDHFDLVSAETVNDSVLPKMLQMRDYFQRLDEVARQREGLQTVMKHIMTATSVTEVAEMVEREVKEAMNCECCTFFFIDDKHDEIWAPPKDTIPDGLCMPFGVGLVGHVAKEAREAQDDDENPSIVITNDPRSCPHWKGDVAGFTTRNIMTAPVWSVHGKERKLLGVIQMLNKKTKRHSRPARKGALHGIMRHHTGFTKVDAEFLAVLSTGVGEVLQRLLLDVMCAKIALDTSNRNNRTQPAMVNEYYITSGKTKTVYRANECLAVAMTMGKDRNDQELAFEKIVSQKDLDTRREADPSRWFVDYWSLTLQEQFRLVLRCLEDCGVFSELTIIQSCLYNFFLNIRETYRDLPYHNFWHALSTVHYACRLVHAAGCRDNLTKADLFAMIIGSLCHDCDHRGHNTAFEVATRSELAIRYNDSSPLENHHCAVAFEVALGGTTNCNIFEQLSPEVYLHVRHRMIAGILSTDMKCHGDHVKLVQTFELKPGMDAGQGQFLVELFMHAADIGNPYMPGEISRRWGEFIAEEFSLQVKHERELGLPVTTFMDGLSDPLAVAKSQGGFIDFVVCPLMDPTFRIFQGLSEPQRCLKDNREWIKTRVEQLTTLRTKSDAEGDQTVSV